MSFDYPAAEWQNPAPFLYRLISVNGPVLGGRLHRPLQCVQHVALMVMNGVTDLKETVIVGWYSISEIRRAIPFNLALLNYTYRAFSEFIDAERRAGRSRLN